MKKVKRNGDWNIIPTNEIIKKKEEKHNGRYVFAEGEATNHFHTIVAPKPSDFKIMKTKYGFLLEVDEEVKITHPEHSLKNDLVVAPGRYKLTQRREKDWFSLSTRKVID